MMTPEKSSSPAALIGEIDINKRNWDGESTFTIGGIKGLTVQDLDKLQLYSAIFIKDGNVSSLCTPDGRIKRVLSIYGII